MRPRLTTIEASLGDDGAIHLLILRLTKYYPGYYNKTAFIHRISISPKDLKGQSEKERATTPASRLLLEIFLQP